MTARVAVTPTAAAGNRDHVEPISMPEAPPPPPPLWVPVRWPLPPLAYPAPPVPAAVAVPGVPLQPTNTVTVLAVALVLSRVPETLAPLPPAALFEPLPPPPPTAVMLIWVCAGIVTGKLDVHALSVTDSVAAPEVDAPYEKFALDDEPPA